MIFRNSVKILINNSMLIWRILSYLLIVLLIVTAASISFFIPIYKSISEQGYIRMINDLFDNFFQGSLNFAEVIAESYNFFQLILDQVANYSLNILFALIIIFVIGRLLVGLQQLTISICIKDFMASNCKPSFTRVFISSSGNSIKFQLQKILLTFPCDLVTIAISIVVNYIFTKIGLSVFRPLVLTGVAIGLSALKNTLFCLWPAVISNEKIAPMSAMNRGVKLVSSRFGHIFSLMLMYNILSLSIVLFFTLFTFGLGLFFALPLSLLFYEVLSMTIYFNLTGKRYYVDKATVVTTLAVEGEE